MGSVLKYDGFLPKNYADSVSSLFRVNLPATTIIPEQTVVLLVDISWSMCYQMQNLKTAILSTVELILTKKITKLEDIVLITFQSFPEEYYNFENLEALENIVSSLESYGGTDYRKAIDKLDLWLKKKKKVSAVIFSDGEPDDENYLQSVEKLKQTAKNIFFLFHAIGLQVNSYAEKLLRDLTSIGSNDGYYQSIDDTEIKESMNVLVDHFSCSLEAFINGKQTCHGFFVDTDTECFVADCLGTGEKVSLKVLNDSFEAMLREKSSIQILDASSFLLEYYIRNESVTFEEAITIAEHVSFLIAETDRLFKKCLSVEIEKISNAKKLKLHSISDSTGASKLKQQSEIISAYNKQVQKIYKGNSECTKRINETKELCTKIKENLHKNRNVSVSVSGEIMNTVRQFRDDSIALKRKNVARLSSKVINENMKFQNIDQLLQDELDQLVKLESIPVPKYFENYADPLTLNDFQEIILYKYGVFMLLINLERHLYGIAAPHRTKIIQIGGFSSSILDVMMNNSENKSMLFDFRGIGFGNAAIPMWINEVHWNKARHVFGPFVGYAVTGNELEYTKLQGQTLLALILLHLRKLEFSEYNQELIRMVSETLNIVIDRNKWKNVLLNISNSFETLNENQIPSVPVFLVFSEFIGVELSNGKVLLLLAEEYRRKNSKHIEMNFQKLEPGIKKRRPSETEDEEQKSKSPPKRNIKGKLLVMSFSKTFDEYLDISAVSVAASLDKNKKSMENYFLNLYDGNDNSRLLKLFEKFSKAIPEQLSKYCSTLSDKQKIAIVLSVHKCTCFKWDAFDKIPAGLSYDDEYPELLLNWCKNVKAQKKKSRTDSQEDLLLKILRSNDEGEVEMLIKNIKRNGHSWGVLLRVLFRSCQVGRPSAFTKDKWNRIYSQTLKKQIESMSIPLHYQLVMYSIFGSFKHEDWISSKMIWRPNSARRHRVKVLFPGAPHIE